MYKTVKMQTNLPVKICHLKVKWLLATRLSQMYTWSLLVEFGGILPAEQNCG